jgi:hypothetical protein
MHRALALLLLLALLPAAGAGADAPAPAELMPGVTFQRQVQFTPHGPVVVDVITAPRPGGLYSIGPVLSTGTVSSPSEPLVQIEKDASVGAIVAGISGDATTGKGIPTGIELEGGTMLHGAAAGRSSIGFDSSGTLHVKRFGFVGTWKGSGQRRPLDGVDELPRSGQVVLFTPRWGPATPVVPNASEVVLEPFPTASANTDLTAPVTAQHTGGGLPIPGDGAVLMSVGSPPLQAEAAEGQSVTVRLILPTDWANVTNAVGGGPLLVRNGKAVFHTNETFDAGDLAKHDARAGVGQLADGRVVLVVADGGQPGYSSGLSNFELAQTMVRLGAVTAAALNSGPAVTEAFDGQLLDRPRVAGGRAIKEALLIQYAGVYAPVPPVTALSRKDAAAGEDLAYRVVRPSTVTASVVGPDGAVHTLDAGQRDPNTYRFTFTGIDEEGTWHWGVTAVDDLGRESSVDQPFTYDLTLSTLSVPASASAATGLTARFRLSRAASVALTIETPRGVVVAAPPAQDEPAGTAALAWDGTLSTGAQAPPGSYLARVTATSVIGTSDLSAPFTVHG